VDGQVEVVNSETIERDADRIGGGAGRKGNHDGIKWRNSPRSSMALPQLLDDRARIEPLVIGFDKPDGVD
jgi:hypothetical protein